MKKRIISLGGLPGSGKSTIRKILAERLGYKTFSTGSFVRDMAHDRNMTLEELNVLIAKDKSLDVLIDEKLIQISDTEDAYIVDSHLAFHFIPNSFSVYLDVSPEESAKRILGDAHSLDRIKSGDVMTSLEDAKKKTRRRIENHIERYTRHYGINPYQASQYTYCINTENSSPEEIAENIITAYQAWLDE